MALQDAAYDPTSASPLDVLCAESEGMIGYLIVQALRNALGDRQPVAALLTRIAVDPADPAFASPAKPIGPLYDKVQSEGLAATHGWTMMADGERFRRAVASPRPLRIFELDTIRRLAEAGTLVVCAGGGGIPVAMSEDGSCRGIEAIIDKDHASRLLALEMKAEALLLLTDVDGLYAGWGGPNRRRLERPQLAELRGMSFAAGTMGPKVAAAIDFISGGGSLAGIGRIEDACDILEDRAGTRITG